MDFVRRFPTITKARKLRGAGATDGTAFRWVYPIEALDVRVEGLNHAPRRAAAVALSFGQLHNDNNQGSSLQESVLRLAKPGTTTAHG